MGGKIRPAYLFVVPHSILNISELEATILKLREFTFKKKKSLFLASYRITKAGNTELTSCTVTNSSI